MEKITGRNDDMIILRGVNLFPTQIEELVLGIEQLTPHFILELSKEGRMDTLKVRIERHPDLSVETCQSAAEVLAQRIKIFVGSTVAVQLAEPGTLPRSEGKYKRVYDLR